jgi:hypothetical protein
MFSLIFDVFLAGMLYIPAFFWLHSNDYADGNEGASLFSSRYFRQDNCRDSTSFMLGCTIANDLKICLPDGKNKMVPNKEVAMTGIPDVSVCIQTGSRVCSLDTQLVRGIKPNKKPHF